MQQRDKLKPILFSIIKHSSKEELKEQIPKDIVAGIVVAVVALGDEHLGAALDVGRAQRKQDAHHGQG